MAAHRQTNLTKQEIEDIVQTKVAEAKAEIAEGRLDKFLKVGAIMLAIVGGLPAINSWFLRNDVQDATERMERSVQEAIRRLGMKPDFNLYFENGALGGQTIPIDSAGQILRFIIQNEGTGTSKNARVFLLTVHTHCRAN
jgi:hypothetical protein